MIVLKTIPEVPAVPAVVDSVFRVKIISIDFINSTVSFQVQSTYTPVSGPYLTEQAPVSRVVSFSEIATLVTPTEVDGFVAIVRNALALSMNVDISKVPIDIFSE